jgi:hypothetical protein
MNDNCCNVPAPARTGTYYPDEIILYGIKLNSINPYSNFYAGRGYELHVQLHDAQTGNPLPNRAYSTVLAYGYAFEGHCYRFDKVRVFIVTGSGDLDPVGCGFDLEPRANEPVLQAPAPPNPIPNPAPTYRMWRIRAADELLELTTTFDSAQALVLDANLPGRRSPTTYSITLQMAHRSGRLTKE